MPRQNMERVLIVDDEPLARKRLRRFLLEYSPDSSLQEASNGLRAVALIRDFRPQVVLMDVAMPGLNGFDVLCQTSDRNFAVIFQTAHASFAVSAFDENACDYLLKPFKKERLFKALDKVTAGLDEKAPRGSRNLTQIMVKSGNQRKLLEVDSIFCFISEAHCTIAYTSQGEYVVDLPLSHLANRLGAEDFLLIHRHAIVRLNSICAVTSGTGMQLKLSNGTILPVARSKRQTIKDWLGAHSS